MQKNLHVCNLETKVFHFKWVFEHSEQLQTLQENEKTARKSRCENLIFKS